ncbi:MAG: O-antigen ligase family protein, partial [Thalassolituus sp.]
GLSAILVFVAAIYSGSRASLIVLLPLMAILIAIYRRKAIFFVISGFIGLAIFGVSSDQLARDVSRTGWSIKQYIYHDNTKTSLGQRFHLWEASLCVHQKYPAWGIGPKVFENVMKDTNDPCHIKVITKKHYFTHAHSLYFHSLATKGVLGSLILLSFFAGIIWFSIKKQFSLSYMTLAAVLTMLTYGISMDLFYTRYIIDKHVTLLGILMGVTVLTSARKNTFGKSNASKDYKQ